VKDAEMPEDTAKRPAVIFLSYRRGDTQWAARGIYDRLVNRYGHQNVFRDLDAIPPGVRFREFIEKKISESDVFILLIGKAWASYKDETGRRRLDLPRDPVRVELETALRLAIPIIPVRVEGAPMPTESDLVPSIMDLLEFNAAELSDSRWDFDVGRLLWAINEMVERGRRSPQAKSAVAPAPPAASTRAQEGRQLRDQNTSVTQPRAGPDPPRSEHAENSSSTGDVLGRRTSRERAAEAQARRDAEAQARRKKEQVERQQPRPGASVGHDRATESSLLTPVEQVRNRTWVAALTLLRRRATVISATVGIGGVVVLVAYLMSARLVEATILGHLPENLRASCTASADKSATCHLADGTVVFYRLFDTAAEAGANVVDENAMAPAGDSCPPSAPSVDTSVVCRYAVGSEKGVVMFSYTVKPPHSFYISRWIADAEPLLRGEMSTANASPQDWTTLQANWTRLAGMG
jgi:TIR domain